LTDDDKKKLLDLIAEHEKKGGAKKGASKTKVDKPKKQATLTGFLGGTKTTEPTEPADSSDADKTKSDPSDTPVAVPSSPSKQVAAAALASNLNTNDASSYDSWEKFCKLCDKIASVSKYTDKSAAVKAFLAQRNFLCFYGSKPSLIEKCLAGFDGDVYLLMKLLLPGTDQRVYNVKEKQLIKLFANVRLLSPCIFISLFMFPSDLRPGRR
jgi:hypothetical protein